MAEGPSNNSQECQSCPNAEASVLEEVGTCVCGCMVKIGKGTEPRPEKMGGQGQVPKQDADIQSPQCGERAEGLRKD